MIPVGYVTHKIEIELRLDNHNGPEQERDRKLADEVERRIWKLLDEPEFEHLDGMTRSG